MVLDFLFDQSLETDPFVYQIGDAPNAQNHTSHSFQEAVNLSEPRLTKYMPNGANVTLNSLSVQTGII